jgi:hypothetical protein
MSTDRQLFVEFFGVVGKFPRRDAWQDFPVGIDHRHCQSGLGTGDLNVGTEDKSGKL